MYTIITGFGPERALPILPTHAVAFQISVKVSEYYCYTSLNILVFCEKVKHIRPTISFYKNLFCNFANLF